MHVHLRIADRADERELHELDHGGHGDDPTKITLVREAVAGGRCLVAEGERIVGYAVTAPRHFFARDFVELLVVHDQHRRRGVGRALLRETVRRAGTTRVFSSTNESNAAMRSLFTSEGWRPSGRLEGLDDGDPEVVYFIDRQPPAPDARLQDQVDLII